MDEFNRLNNENEVHLMSKLLNKLNNMIEIKGFYISEPGDPSVERPATTWALKGYFIFEDNDELNTFKSNLQKTFENYCGVAKVQTIDEVDKMDSDN